jgi:hypothetical protein
LDKNKQIKSTPKYEKQADEYIKLLDDSKYSLEENMIRIYIVEGYVVYHFNQIQRDNTFLTQMILYFTLLQSSIILVGKKYNGKYSTLSLKDNKYYLFRGAKLPKDLLKLDRFIVFNEFLSTTYDRNTALGFALHGDLTDDLCTVLYEIIIDKKDFDNNPTILSFIQDISLHKSEKEVLLSSTTIFQYKEIHHNYQCNIVKLQFISNGYNKYDYI